MQNRREITIVTVNCAGQTMEMEPGRLRLYVGAAAGAGATYAMLDEALRRQGRGTTVTIGWIDAHSRRNTLELLQRISGSRQVPTHLDVDAIIAQRPEVVLVDEVGHMSGTVRHWQAINRILDAGINVLGTLNVQHVASLRDPVTEILGREPDGSVSDRFLSRAEQIEIVDITPEAIRRRLAHGNVFAPEEFNSRDADIFNSDAFTQLRILMLQWMNSRLLVGTRSLVESREVIVVALDDSQSSGIVARRAARLAQRCNGSLIGLHVAATSVDSQNNNRARRREIIEDLGGNYAEVTATDVAGAIASFVASEHATQVVIGSPRHHRLSRIQRSTLAGDLISRNPSADVHLVATEQESNRWKPIERLPSLTNKRQLLGWILGALLLSTLTISLASVRGDTSVATGLSLYLLAVIGITAIGGRWPGVVAAVISPLLANWYFIPPYHTFRISRGENLIELIAFISSAIIVSIFVSAAARRALEANHAWREAATLSALAESSSVDPVEGILELLVQSFHLDGVSIIDVSGSTPFVISSSGTTSPQSAEGADIAVPLDNDTYLVGHGETLSPDDRRVLHAFVGQLNKALQQRALREVALEADTLARADELRTAILRAVSHDLRSPLSSIKASVSSLRQNDIDWPEDVRNEFLASIESETDRLTSIVTNLLDLSRIEAGVLRPVIRSVSLEEIIPAVIHASGPRESRIATDISADAAEVAADPMLLERVVANLVGNALFWSPENRKVTVRAFRRAHMVQIHVIDHGPGIPASERSTVVQPFHRLHDNVNDGGLGLGLAIADRLVAAMFGSLELLDTPGGGLTVVVSLPCVEVDFS